MGISVLEVNEVFIYISCSVYHFYEVKCEVSLHLNITTPIVLQKDNYVGNLVRDRSYGANHRSTKQPTRGINSLFP